MIRSALLSALLLLTFQSVGYCFDNGRSPRELLANDKDERSVVIGDRDVKRADQTLGGIQASQERLNQVAQALADSLFATEAPVCEPLTLRFLAKTAQENSLQSDPESLKAILVALRSANALDDLVLLPLLKALPAYAEYEKSPLADEKGNCPSDDYIERLTRLKGTLGKKYKRSAIANEIQVEAERKHLSPYQEQWLNLLHGVHWDEVPFTLAKVVRGIKAVKNTFPNKEASEPTAFSSKIRKKSGGLTFRMSIYKKFTAEQLGMLSEIQRQFIRRKFPTTDLEIRATIHDSETETEVQSYPIVGEDKKYRVVAAWYYADIQNAQKRGKLFQGLQIEVDDVVAAALESGVVNSYEVNRMLKVEEIWNPKTPTWQKVLTIVQKYGGPALIFAPPPFNILASTALTFLQTSLFKTDKTGADPDYLRVSPF
jgi:hypothetical protein